ncbi:MAG: UDP-N-acetyl-D-glucosamine dehydrogenase [bacterium (Candidatus Stahlbacteria) CG08_land_8_20_14_0_20_40_26]|nr:MAG: UDP-N-acetyl-D-glucosamine dehydrogenase [bacterium (Candidatus Stahlbacteria) CG08_land_8_20_14_0_20_40_26]
MLKERIESKKALVGVIGLGYVGLPLACAFARKGFRVVGIDRKKGRVNSVNRGESYIQDISSHELSGLVRKGLIRASTDYNDIKECDVVQICVPTPINENKDPDISYIVATSKKLSRVLHPDELIILKSTTFPLTTKEVVLPILKKSGLTMGKDLFLAFSPERVDPGNKKYTMRNTPVVVGGIDETSTELAYLLYERVIGKVKRVSSAETAEFTKLLENIFRNVNIALVNELTMLTDRMGINIWEVIDAAATKPFGFMPFYPGPGVGGHCIPIDPYYLSWKAKEYDFHTNFIEISAETNEGMPYYVANIVISALSNTGVCPKTANVLVIGVTFKRDVKDMRDSPSLKIIEILKNKVAKICYSDPFIEKIDLQNSVYKSLPLTGKTISKFDCTLIITDHSSYDYDFIVQNSKLVIDTRNATKMVKEGRDKIVLLGGGILSNKR